ncbi:hypothetical protein [Bacillus solitudinis]|uniref:hypothetical protein n=1 Tax=Bacillus solitudinis TaxID=2014074 RepID=UPI000C24756B|nr:hypothetical protein [Bacillus solitudinis]
MKKEFYSKTEVINYVWQYSRHHGELLSYCEIAREESGNGHAALIFLFNLTENIFKDRLENYDASLHDIISTLKDEGIITHKEHDFLNEHDDSIRKLRNLLAHANLSKYNLTFIEDDKEIYYPLTENETCLKLFDIISDILFNLMLRIVSVNFEKPLEISLDEKIDNVEIKIKEFTPEELMGFKGIDVSTVSDWHTLSETDRYRFAENASDVKGVSAIAEGLMDSQHLTRQLF